MKTKQTGFVIIDSVLTLLIILVAIGGGIAIWHNEKNKNKPIVSASANTTTATTSVAPYQSTFSKVPAGLQTQILSEFKKDAPACVKDNQIVDINGKVTDIDVDYAPSGSALAGIGCDSPSSGLFIKNDSGDWAFIEKSQMAFDCSVLEKYNVPKALLELNTDAECFDAQTNNLVPYNPSAASTSSSPSTNQNTSSKTSSPSGSATSSTKYFTISQWGVRAPYGGSLNLEYSLNGSDSLPWVGTFSSTQLDASSAQCSYKTYGGQVKRYRATDGVVLSDGSASGQTAAEYAASLDKSDYGHVGDYYYFFQHAQSACGDSQTSGDIETQTNNAVKALLPDLQAIPQ